MIRLSVSASDLSAGGMSRRSFLSATGAGAAGISGAAVARGAPVADAGKRPNILLIVAEDMGQEIGCYGDRTAPTPHLDALAARGVLFKNAYVTQASCSPSRSSILTGLYPHQNFQLGLAHHGYRTHTEIPNLPALLKQAGYRTGVAGKVHVSPESQFPFDERGTKHGKDIPAYGAWAKQFLGRNPEKPFFLYINFGDCHKPFARQVAGLPERPVTESDVRPFPVHRGLDAPEVLAETAGYYHSVQRVDAGIGLLMDALRVTGHDGDTLVVFIGDHGPPVARGKTTTYEFGIKIPFLVAWPGHAAVGLRSDALISTVDILPTCLTAAGVPLPSPLAGRPLQALVNGDTDGWRSTLCAEWHTHGPGFMPQRCIRDDRYKLILNLRTDIPKPGLNVDGSTMGKVVQSDRYADTPVRGVFDLLQSPPAAELYDLLEDPIEYVNLAGKPECREIESRLRQALDDWRRETRDPLLDPAVFEALRKHYDTYRASVPALRKERPKQKRFPIDMGRFQRRWRDVVREDYGIVDDEEQ